MPETRCINCDEPTEILYTVQGYRVCESCRDLSEMPWWLR